MRPQTTPAPVAIKFVKIVFIFRISSDQTLNLQSHSSCCTELTVQSSNHEKPNLFFPWCCHFYFFFSWPIFLQGFYWHPFPSDFISLHDPSATPSHFPHPFPSQKFLPQSLHLPLADEKKRKKKRPISGVLHTVSVGVQLLLWYGTEQPQTQTVMCVRQRETEYNRFPAPPLPLHNTAY